MAKYPKFDNHIDERVRQRENTLPGPGRWGIISSYDQYTNTATVILASPDSDGVGDIVPNVQCPVYMGIQLAAPEPGRPCWVVFVGSKNDSRPIITNYFNFDYAKRDFYRHSDARHGVSQYMLSM